MQGQTPVNGVEHLANRSAHDAGVVWTYASPCESRRRLRPHGCLTESTVISADTARLVSVGTISAHPPGSCQACPARSQSAVARARTAPASPAPRARRWSLPWRTHRVRHADAPVWSERFMRDSALRRRASVRRLDAGTAPRSPGQRGSGCSGRRSCRREPSRRSLLLAPERWCGRRPSQS